MKKNVFLGSIVAAVLFITSGCSNSVVSGDKKTESISIKKDHAKKLDVQLNFGAGSLQVSKGAKKWVEGKIEYNGKKEPIVDYKLVGNKGKINIDQPSEKNIRNVKNNWDIQLNDRVPINLKVDTGASDTDLDLQGLKLSSLRVNAGVGDIKVDLSGNWKKSFDAIIETGVGNSTIILPANVGVKITSEKGIGSASYKNLISKGDGVYVNEAYKDTDVILNIHTELGVGKVTFKTE